MKNAINSKEGLSPQPRISPNLSSKREQSEGNSKSTKTDISESSVQGFKDGLQLVHSSPGRIRLRANDGSFSSVVDKISQQLRQHDGVGEVSINQQTGSLTVTFDKNKLSLPQILRMLQQFGVSEPQTSLSAPKKTDPFAAWKSIDFWKEQGFDLIPLMTGLLVTGRLGIHGLASLPVYMITAGATRQVIDRMREQGQRSREQGEERLMTEPCKVTNNTKESENPAQSSRLVPAPCSPLPAPFKIVHAIPGRVRFNVPRVAKDQAYATRLEKLLKANSQVTSVRVNRDAASVVISYKPRDVPESHWVDLMESVTTQQPSPDETSEADVLITLITATQQTNSEAASVWAELKPQALSCALSVMANFPLEDVSESASPD